MHWHELAQALTMGSAPRSLLPNKINSVMMPQSKSEGL
jgi:hypothetical protein